jgi:haloalkane dehalogenase
MDIVRTPASRFEGLEEYPFADNYLEVPFGNQQLRMHYVDEGDKAGETVVLVHGEPSWSYQYRKFVPPLVKAGCRVIAPDLIGFGKSDKPTRIDDYTYDRQEDSLRTALFDVLELKDITLFCMDWGGLLSLRLVAFEPERFARVMVSNTGLPVGGKDSNFLPDDAPRKLIGLVGARIWQAFARWAPVFPVGRLAQQLASKSELSAEVVAGYDAPFPSNRYKAGVRAMPQRIPLDPKTPDSKRNREAWRRLADFDKPFRTAFSEHDACMKMLPVDTFYHRHVRGAQNQRHVVIPDAGHFLQEDNGDRVVQELIAFIAENPR